jgi:hypothetical protein
MGEMKEKLEGLEVIGKKEFGSIADNWDAINKDEDENKNHNYENKGEWASKENDSWASNAIKKE